MYCLLGTYQSLSLVVFNNFRENNISTVNQSFRFHDILLYCLSVFLLISHFCEAIDHGKDIRVIVCDISKAFDGVWHSEYLNYKLLVLVQVYLIGLKIICMTYNILHNLAARYLCSLLPENNYARYTLRNSSHQRNLHDEYILYLIFSIHAKIMERTV